MALYYRLLNPYFFIATAVVTILRIHTLKILDYGEYIFRNLNEVSISP